MIPIKDFITMKCEDGIPTCQRTIDVIHTFGLLARIKEEHYQRWLTYESFLLIKLIADQYCYVLYIFVYCMRSRTNPLIFVSILQPSAFVTFNAANS